MKYLDLGLILHNKGVLLLSYALRFLNFLKYLKSHAQRAILGWGFWFSLLMTKLLIFSHNVWLAALGTCSVCLYTVFAAKTEWWGIHWIRIMDMFFKSYLPLNNLINKHHGVTHKQIFWTHSTNCLSALQVAALSCNFFPNSSPFYGH